MKTLYITDLDGTLLNSEGVISDKTKEIINRLSKEGLLFSVATSRSILSAIPLLDGVNITAPVVAMSGVAVYDTANKKTVNYYSIDEKSYYRLIEIFEKYGKAPFSFFFNKNNEEYEIIFTDLKLDEHKKYYDIRKNSLGVNIHRVEKYEIPENASPVFTSLCDRYEDLIKITSEIDKMPELSYSFYKDTYTAYWFLEVFNAKASKADGLRIVKEYTGADEAVAFGDNNNDLPLFAAADRKYAVKNAVEELKAKADGIIASNDEDAVAEFVKKDFK